MRKALIIAAVQVLAGSPSFALDAAASPSACVVHYANAASRAAAVVDRRLSRIPPADVTPAADRRRLALLARRDQDSRAALMGALRRCTSAPVALGPVFAAVRASDDANLSRLRQILSRITWPVITRYGAAADQAAFLVVQHADREPSYQRAVLSRLQPLVAAGDTAPENYALLFDRLAQADHQLQRFGTQGSCDGASWRADPVAEPDALEVRRAALGLEPLASYAARASRLCGG